jgi:hypothetical protein
LANSGLLRRCWKASGRRLARLLRRRTGRGINHRLISPEHAALRVHALHRKIWDAEIGVEIRTEHWTPPQL